MSVLDERILAVAKRFMGPAAQAFIRRELAALGTSAGAMSERDLPTFAAHAQRSAARLMGDPRAAEFAAALLACGKALPPSAAAAIGRDDDALDAAATLARDGKLMKAEAAYREIIARGGAGAAAHLGLARTTIALDDPGRALAALRDGAVGLTRAGDRARAIELLSEAVRIAPLDHAAHRRLAAAHANARDKVAARAEYARFVALALAQGDAHRAELETSYALRTLGEPTSAERAKPAPGPLTADQPAAVDDPGLVARLQAVAVPPAEPGTAPLTVPELPAPSGSPPVASPPLSSVVPHPRALLEGRKLYAASDVLLEYIGRGGTDREAQLLLIDVASTIGLVEAASDKARLLATAYRLDGSEQFANAVEGRSQST
ncbi:MAG: hypothetical protein ABR525_10515 [Candidatus Limnocylindria bacterium]